MSTHEEKTEQRIREHAYRLWQEAGEPEGRQDEFWQKARDYFAPHAPVQNDDLDAAGEHSFPASDPVNHT